MNAAGLDGDGPCVEAVEAAAYTVPTDAPEADGTLAWNATTLIVVTAHSGDATGLGYTYAPAVTARVVHEVLAGEVTGRPVWHVPAANEAMQRAVRNAGRPGLVAAAISAVDIALWDLKARLLHMPLTALLGATNRQVPVYGSGGFTTYDDRRQDGQLRHWVREQAIPRVKIKVGESWGQAEGRDRERIAKARRSIGDAAELYVDANGGYGRKQAIRLADCLAEHAVTWFEEPVSSDDATGLAQIRAAVPADVAAGEYGYTLAHFAGLLRAEAVDCLQADVTRCGGITVWLRAAALAQAAGLQISAHCAPHAHAHAVAAVPNLRHVEWFHDHVRVERLLFDGTLDPGGGSVTPGANGAPGHGLTLRAEQAAAYRTA